MIKLKKITAVALGATMFMLCSCSGGRYDFHEIENLELIETIGIDVLNEVVTVSAASGSGQSAAPTILSNSAYTVGLALREMQTMTDKDIYFAHVSNCVVGEETAREGLSMYLDFIERELSVRYTTGMFIVHGGTAKSAITKVGDENSCVTELLGAMKKDVKILSDGYVYSVGEVAQSMLENGCALVTAVKVTENKGIVSGGSMISVEPDGYALIRGDRLAAFIDKETAHGVNILMNKTGADTVEVNDGTGGICALTVTSERAVYRAHYGADGIPRVVDIDIKLTANIEELHDMIDIYDEKQIGLIEEGLQEVENKRTVAALELIKEYGLDFVGIGKALEMKHPIRFAAVKKVWQEILPGIEFNINWDTEIVRTYDIGVPIGFKESESVT